LLGCKSINDLSRAHLVPAGAAAFLQNEA
jgi:hypothetical protein